MGSYPLERLARQSEMPDFASVAQDALSMKDESNPYSLANSMGGYAVLYDRLRDGPVVPHQAPIPEGLEERANHFKASCYYMDASMAATCLIPDRAILDQPINNPDLEKVEAAEASSRSKANKMSEGALQLGEMIMAAKKAAARPFRELGHTHAIVLLVEYARDPKEGEPGYEWMKGTQAQRATIRAGEVAAHTSQYLRFLGYSARHHMATATDVDMDQMLLASGLGEVVGVNGSARVENPYLGRRFGMAVVTTTLEMATDQPLAPRGLVDKWKAHGPGWYFGFGGTKPGMSWANARDNRPHHLGPYPMEKVKRVDEPTTLIDEENVPRIPKRHEMFNRAAFGDLGPKAHKEMSSFRFISKNVYSHAMAPQLGAMVPLQQGPVNPNKCEELEATPDVNAEALKALCYYMGADMVGVCKIPDYAWYSHDFDGSEIQPYHRYAVAVLVDQGYETMEGASGDDWVSGAQSMRAYLRAGQICGVVSSHIRNLGYSARSHGVMDQDVLHIPLILQAGLGELSRIGELVLNPYVGPRFKSGVITFDMPVTPDKPVDFGLQDFCEKCNKCARECPVTAIPHGPKIMFNGYEMWKPDVEKCARYRITNSGGAGCGRCMKTCPYNLEGVMKEAPFLWMAHHLPFTRSWLARLDDKVGNGTINPIKKWWLDMDQAEDGRIIPAPRTNKRELSFRATQTEADKQVMACYPKELASPPVSDVPVPLDRKAGIEAYKIAKSAEEYKAQMRGR
ncbi:MAG: hypothetical protein CMF31_07830 [Kordiimonas sp.]|nr:hypothetical protein [Kordiimonas sp.]|tara:strand:- start:1593 stop:3809 length:2217 start_codon:yes stop_codon:yes gene_type:complete